MWFVNSVSLRYYNGMNSTPELSLISTDCISQSLGLGTAPHTNLAQARPRLGSLLNIMKTTFKLSYVNGSLSDHYKTQKIAQWFP